MLYVKVRTMGKATGMGSGGARANKTNPSPSRDEKPWHEDWSVHGFYNTMRRLFRARPDPTGKDGKAIIRLVEPPFYRNKPLSRAQFHAAVEQCLASEGLERRHLVQKPVNVPIIPPQDLIAAGVPEDLSWKCNGALGRLHFAETMSQQAKAKQEVRDLDQQGPRSFRKMLKRILEELPQRKRTRTHKKILFELLPYRRVRQFTWAFLRAEAMAGWNCTRHELRDVLRDPASGRLEELHKAYSFLHLSLEDLRRGLANSHQADEDVAEEFDLSVKTLRSLLSKYHPLVQSKHK